MNPFPRQDLIHEKGVLIKTNVHSVIVSAFFLCEYSLKGEFHWRKISNKRFLRSIGQFMRFCIKVDVAVFTLIDVYFLPCSGDGVLISIYLYSTQRISSIFLMGRVSFILLLYSISAESEVFKFLFLKIVFSLTNIDMYIHIQHV